MVKAVVDLVLAACVFVVDLLQLKAQLHQRASHILQVSRIAVNGLEIVGRLVQLVMGIGYLPDSTHLAQQKEFRFDADPHAPATRVQLSHGGFQDLARTRIQRLTARKTVTYSTRYTRHKRQRLQGVRQHTPVVLAARAHTRQSCPPNAGAGKASAHLHPLLQLFKWYQLPLGNAMKITKLGQNGMHALGLQGTNGVGVVMHKNGR